MSDEGVAGPDVMRAVTGTTIAQFGTQGLGMALAGAARLVGIVALASDVARME